jgi:hypothetical protein
VTGGHSLSIAFTPKHAPGPQGPQPMAAFQIPLTQLRDARERCLDGIVGAERAEEGAAT